MKLQPFNFGRLKRFVERARLVGVQVVQDQPDHFGVRVCSATSFDERSPRQCGARSPRHAAIHPSATDHEHSLVLRRSTRPGAALMAGVDFAWISVSFCTLGGTSPAPPPSAPRTHRGGAIWRSNVKRSRTEWIFTGVFTYPCCVIAGQFDWPLSRCRLECPVRVSFGRFPRIRCASCLPCHSVSLIPTARTASASGKQPHISYLTVPKSFGFEQRERPLDEGAPAGNLIEAGPFGLA